MNLKCTVLGSGTGYIYLDSQTKYVQNIGTLKDILELGNKWKEQIDILRALPYHSDKQVELKKQYPCWIPQGIFKQGDVHNTGIDIYSNLLAIDIDKIDNPDADIEKIKKEIFNMPQVVLVMKSISGEGLWVLFLVEDGQFTSDYCRYIEKLFAYKYNAEIDKRCYNIARKRFISYDDDILIKSEDTEIIPWKLKLLEQNVKPKSDTLLFDYKQKYVSNIDEDIDFERKVDLLIELGYDVGPHWKDWATFGRIFKPFNNGKELFERISRNMSAYNSKTFNKDWDRIDSKYIMSKSHAVAYITTILNKNYSGWKDKYYKK